MHLALRQGAVDRRRLTDRECSSFFRAVDHRDTNAFGVRSLYVLDLDCLFPLPSKHVAAGSCNVGFENYVTILAYAAWRRRHSAVKALLIAGASAILSERMSLQSGPLNDSDHASIVELLTNRNGHGLASAAAVYAVEQVVKLRAFAARDAALLGSNQRYGCAQQWIIV